MYAYVHIALEASQSCQDVNNGACNYNCIFHLKTTMFASDSYQHMFVESIPRNVHRCLVHKQLLAGHVHLITLLMWLALESRLLIHSKR